MNLRNDQLRDIIVRAEYRMKQRYVKRDEILKEFRKEFRKEMNNG